MKTLKQFVVSKLSEKQIRRWRQTKKWIREYLPQWIAKPFLKLIQILPLSVQAVIREELMPVGTLDYSAYPAQMYVESQIQYKRLLSSEKEPDTIKWIETYLKPHDIFYDIGANVGAYSFVACSIIAGQGRIIAFEPGFSTYTALCRNIFLNRVNNTIIPMPVALSNVTEIGQFIYSDLLPGTASHPGITNRADNSKVSPSLSHSVLCYRLDDLLAQLNIPLPNLIKIDVDGAELAVLQGADKTLSQPAIRSILIEIDFGLDGHEATLAYLDSHNYYEAVRYQHAASTTYDCVFLRR